jgi:glucose-1-phosphate thymidylyltransferase
LAPLTSGFSKQLLPIYDKPMIYYPISVMMLAGIREILIITTPSDLPFFKKILGDGENFGMRLDFISQDSPDGIAQAFILGENFIGSDNVSLILGDNIFFGYGFSKMLLEASNLNHGARIFTTYVQDPRAYAVAEFDELGSVLSLEEKPQSPKSNYAVTGLYFYDNSVIEISKNLKPSARGELEITDVNIEYLKKGTLKSSQLGRGFAWLDTGTHESLLDAGEFVSTIEKRQGLKIACLEEIAFNNGWIDHSALLRQAQKFHNSPYGQYLKALID